MIVLEILQGTAEQRLHRIANTTASIGRSPASTVALSDYHLSGDHAVITQIGDHYVFRDLRSTNGSAVERAGKRIPVDATARWEIALTDGDLLLLGNRADPVRIAVRIGEEADEELGDRLIASRSIMDLPQVTDQLEGRATAEALRIYKSLQPLGARLEPSEVIEAIVAATFELLPRATHVAVLLRSETDKDRFALAVSRQRATNDPALTTADPVRASRAVLRRVLGARAAVLTANAQEELSSSESIMGGQILSMLAVPLWRGDDIIGLIQADNRFSAGMFHEADLETSLLLGAQAALVGAGAQSRAHQENGGEHGEAQHAERRRRRRHAALVELGERGQGSRDEAAAVAGPGRRGGEQRGRGKAGHAVAHQRCA